MDPNKPDASPTTNTRQEDRHEDIDPWSEFLSESSDELQAQQSAEEAGAAGTSAEVAAVPGSRAAAEPPPTPHDAPGADVVRVSIAPLAPQRDDHVTQVVPDTTAVELSEKPNSSPRVERDERLAEPRPSPATPFIPRGETRDLPPPPSAWPPAVDVAPTPAAPLASALNEIAAPEPIVESPPAPPPDVRATPAPSRTAPSSVAVASAISLHDVLRRQTPVHWSEAVAVVEDLCAALAATSQTNPAIPDLADILISSEGQATVRAGARGDRDVATMGRTLHALLASTTTPLPLRLFVTSSISSDRFKTLALYADALSYYGMPRRTELIRALHERAASIVRAVPAVIQGHTQSPPPMAIPVGAPVERKRKRSYTVLWAAAIFTGVLIGTGAALSMWSAPSRVDTSGTALTSNASEASTQLRDDWQLGAVTVAGTPSKSKTPPPPPPAPPRKDDARTKAPQKVPPVTTATPARTVSLPPTITASPVPQAPAPVVRPPIQSAPEPRVTPPSAPPTVVATQPPDSNIYSEQDRDVTPPILLSKRPVPPPSSGPNDTQVSNTIELVIDVTGHVVQVKMLDRPLRMTDTLLPQEAKNLLFKPATKDGHPVQYRYLLRTVVSPR
jgi:hypothetical protein